uniref:Uncharacterized protein n=1 Tax=Neogobius melanostomus TaxID=47308 RepID=A0A8C6TYW1_9GOBI
MPRGKGSRRSLAAKRRREKQLAGQLISLVFEARGPGYRHPAKVWPTGVSGKQHRLVLPQGSPDKKFVLLVGNSHLRSIVEQHVPMQEGHYSFGFSATPGGGPWHIHRELVETTLPREPALVCLMAPCNGLTTCRTLDQAAREFGQLLAYVCGRWSKVCVVDFPPRRSADLEIQALLRQAYHRIAVRMGIRYFPTHLSDDRGMPILVQLLWQACYMQLELDDAAAVVPVSPPPPRPATRRVSPRVEVETVFSIPLSPCLFSPAMLVEMERISPSHGGCGQGIGSFPSGKKVSIRSHVKCGCLIMVSELVK